jgi:hypothetical protein
MARPGTVEPRARAEAASFLQGGRVARGFDAFVKMPPRRAGTRVRLAWVASAAKAAGVQTSGVRFGLQTVCGAAYRGLAAAASCSTRSSAVTALRASGRRSLRPCRADPLPCAPSPSSSGVGTRSEERPARWFPKFAPTDDAGEFSRWNYASPPTLDAGLAGRLMATRAGRASPEGRDRRADVSAGAGTRMQRCSSRPRRARRRRCESAGSPSWLPADGRRDVRAPVVGGVATCRRADRRRSSAATAASSAPL